MKSLPKCIAALFMVAVIGFGFSNFVLAEPYQNYVYSSDGKANAEPQAYLPKEKITGASLGIGDFKQPKNIYVSSHNDIYIVDTGNNRLVVLDENYKLERVIKEFKNNGVKDSFNSPQAVFCTDEAIYVADTGNARIVIMNYGLEVIHIFERPESTLISDEFEYRPINLAVDTAGRIFVVSENVNQGIIELTPDGEFVSFLGAVKVKQTVLQALWRTVATKEQKEKMELYLPTQYASIDIDQSGFLYGTVSDISEDNFSEEMFITRLNPMGKDVLKRNGFQSPMGDIELRVDESSLEKSYSALVDIAVRDKGVYSVLDQKMGRIFTYDSTGTLMYVFGALGENFGQFGVPQALDTIGEQALVVDSGYNWVLCFEPTEYGKIINEAVYSFSERDYERTDELWAEALKYTAKSNLAYDGIGRSMLKSGDYESAMTYLRAANDRTNYSNSFEQFRASVLEENFSLIVIFSAVLLGILIVCLTIKKIRKGRK